MRSHFISRVRDPYGNILENISISIYLAGTTTPAKVYTSESSATPIETAPQIVSDVDGLFLFYTDDSDYAVNQLLDIKVGDKTYENIRISGSNVGVSINNSLARYNGTDTIQGSGITVDDSDNISNAGDISMNRAYVSGTTAGAGYLYAGGSAPSNSRRMNYDGYFYATKVFNAVFNDIVDYQRVSGKVEYGKCYYDTEEGAKICNQRCQMSVIGIASDTFGFGVGTSAESVPIAIAGWVLAHVDREYQMGTPLTNDENGNLTEMTMREKQYYPERMVGIYKKKETRDRWPQFSKDKVKVNGRHWIKVL